MRQLLLDGLRNIVERDTTAGTHRMEDRSFGEGGLVDGLSWSDSKRLNDLVYGDRG